MLLSIPLVVIEDFTEAFDKGEAAIFVFVVLLSNGYQETLQNYLKLETKILKFKIEISCEFPLEECIGRHAKCNLRNKLRGIFLDVSLNIIS